MVSQQDINIENKSDNVEIVNKKLDYSECLKLYKRAKINVVVLKEAGGVFGLTSILDSFMVGVPLIVSKTCEQSIPVEKWGIGVEVPVGDENALSGAINKMLNDKIFYDGCRKNIQKLIATGFTMENFTKNVEKELERVLE